MRDPGRRALARAVAALALLLAGIAFAAAVDATATLDAWILAHTRDDEQDLTVHAVDVPRSASDHQAALVADPRHDVRWVVASAHGPLDAARTVVLVPQFHRSPVDPIVWSSLGQAIADVQDNVDALLWHLVTRHGLRCVGSEGSWSARIERTPELDLVAGWGLELAARSDEVVARLAVEDPRLAPAVHTVDAALGPYVERSLRMLDGAGVVQARLRRLGRPLLPPLERFGLEDRALNQRAVQLAGQVNQLYLRLARLLPEEQSVAQDAIGALWLAEYPAFASDTAQHLVRALDELAAVRLALHQAEAVDEAQLLGRYAGLAQEMTDRLLQLDAVAERYQHELLVASREQEAATRPAERRLSPAEQRELARLQRQAEHLDTQYAEVIGRRRERHAVAKTLARLRQAPNALCALIMGASHSKALVAELLRASQGQVAVLVVQPFPRDGKAAAVDGGPGGDAGAIADAAVAH